MSYPDGGSGGLRLDRGWLPATISLFENPHQQNEVIRSELAVCRLFGKNGIHNSFVNYLRRVSWRAARGRNLNVGERCVDV
jgi:hypothetical protein